MNNSNFNPNEEIEAMKTTDAAETPVNDAPAAEQAAPAETVADTTVSEPETVQETVDASADEPAATAESVVQKSAHMTAAAAALNVEGEEVDIRRRQPRVQKEIKKSRISYEKKK